VGSEREQPPKLVFIRSLRRAANSFSEKARSGGADAGNGLIWIREAGRKARKGIAMFRRKRRYEDFAEERNLKTHSI